MDDIELDALVIRLANSSIKEIQNNLLHNTYDPEEVPYIEGYLKHKIEEERNAPTCMYHRRKAPEGKTFKAYEVPALEKKGWVDSPTKFSKGVRGHWYSFIIFCSHSWDSLKTFWLSHWKWIISTIIFTILSIIGLYLAWLQLTKTK